MSHTVHVVDCIDTEGPLYESIEETFVRLKSVFNIELEASQENLGRLQDKKIPLGGKETVVAEAFNRHNQTYHDTWDKIDDMLAELMSADFRFKLQDSFGGGWRYNWFCLDHVGYDDNPRRRDMGYHNVFDHYGDFLRRAKAEDQRYFHYHPLAFSKRGNHCGTHYFSTGDRIFQILSRRVVDRGWFPSVNRPGFHVARPDSHWLLEQFVPFDIANEGTDQDYSSHLDIADGRLGDWRRAPRNWQPYHPSHDDYQVPGNCRRWIARALQVGGRGRFLTQKDVDQAFAEAGKGLPALLCFHHHDFRDMRAEIAQVREMLASAATRFPDVRFKYCDVREAMRSALCLPDNGRCDLDVELKDNKLVVRSAKGTFGPQPYLALKSKSGQYYHDTFDFQTPFHHWTYTFDENSLNVDAIETVGVASCDAAGRVTVARLKPGERATLTHW